MTFKKIVTLSIIAFFAFGLFAMAEEPRESEDPCDDTSTTASSTSTTTSTTTSKLNKASKSEKKSVKKTTAVQNTTSPQTQSTEPKAVLEEESNVTYVSPTPTPVYSNRNHGYSVQQIRNMPMVARPDRPGHFFGNTVRAFYRTRRGR